MRVVVTGALGYVGSVLVPLLAARGHCVTALDIRRPEQVYGAAGARALNGHFVQADIRDGTAMKRALGDADAVVHLAALVGYPACDADAEAARSVNEAGTQNVIAAMPAAARFVFLSTTSIYGRLAGDLCSEDSPIRPLSLYACTKARAETRALERGCVALRPATAFGPSPNFRDDLIIHDFILRGLRGEHLRLFEPEAMRSFVQVEDLAGAILHALENYEAMVGRAYNVAAADAVLSKVELARRVAALTGLRISTVDGDFDPDGRDYRIDSSRLAATGYAMLPRFAGRLNETAAWMKACYGARRAMRG